MITLEEMKSLKDVPCCLMAIPGLVPHNTESTNKGSRYHSTDKGHKNRGLNYLKWRIYIHICIHATFWRMYLWWSLCALYLLACQVELTSPSSILQPRGSLGHHRWFRNQFPSFFPVLHYPMGLGELQACPLPDVVFPPLPLSALSSSPFDCALQDGFGQTWWSTLYHP